MQKEKENKMVSINCQEIACSIDEAGWQYFNAKNVFEETKHIVENFWWLWYLFRSTSTYSNSSYHHFKAWKVGNRP